MHIASTLGLMCVENLNRAWDLSIVPHSPIMMTTSDLHPKIEPHERDDACKTSSMIYWESSMVFTLYCAQP